MSLTHDSGVLLTRSDIWCLVSPTHTITHEKQHHHHSLLLPIAIKSRRKCVYVEKEEVVMIALCFFAPFSSIPYSMPYEWHDTHMWHFLSNSIWLGIIFVVVSFLCFPVRERDTQWLVLCFFRVIEHLEEVSLGMWQIRLSKIERCVFWWEVTLLLAPLYDLQHILGTIP